MAEKESIFSKEYQTGTKTSSEPTSGLISDVGKYQGRKAASLPVEIDLKRYGINKPKRIVIRAKIIHDKN